MFNKASYLKVISMVLCLAMLWGCATIMHGTKQNIGISSTPTGATVIIDNELCGSTPVIKDLSRGKNHIVRIEMKGYLPYETTITRSVSGWVWGNIIIGGLIGLVIDALSGGLYKLTPAQVEATLAKENAGHLYKNNTLFVAVALKVDPSWQKIGQLERAK